MTTLSRPWLFYTEKCTVVSTHAHTSGATGTGRTAHLVSYLSSTAELVAKLYEAAVKKVPLSEEYHSHLFMAYARVGEYKKMQQVRQEYEMSKI